MTALQPELDKLDIEVLVRYAVRDEEYDEALAVIDSYREHPAASRLLRNYYEALPEAREEMAVELRLVRERQGTALMVVKSTNHRYLYLSSEVESLYIGDFDNGLVDEEILSFFGYRNSEDFTKQVVQRYPDLQRVPASQRPQERTTCVACGAAAGRYHVLGCPVEQCPWCEAQLSRCNCRFDQLGVDRIDDEALLDRFEELLEQKGRIAFQADDNPSYPSAGNDPAPGEIKNRPS